MKIGQQHINRAKLETGRDEDIGLARKCGHPIMARRAGLHDAQAGCANGDDPSPSGSGCGDAIGRICADLAPFTVHSVIGNVLDSDRQKSTSPDMQRDLGNANPARSQPGHQRIGEVQTCRWCGDRSLLAGEHRLIIIGISTGGAIRPRDIGRQGHAAMGGKARIHLTGGEIAPIFGIDKGQLNITTRPPPPHTRRKISGKMDNVVGPAFFCRFGEYPPDIGHAVSLFLLVQGDIDSRFTAPPAEPCGNDTGVVDNQQITRTQ